jgi:hypothetical protein
MVQINPVQGGEQRQLEAPELLTAFALASWGCSGIFGAWMTCILPCRFASTVSLYPYSWSLSLVDSIIFISSGLGTIFTVLTTPLTVAGVAFLGMGETSLTVTP